MRGRYWAGIEAGGTKWLFAVGERSGPPHCTCRIPTEDPERTVRRVAEMLAAYPLVGVGLGSFGPIGVVPERADYGVLRATPKPGWQGFPLRARLEKALGAPVRVVTDVAAAAWGELHLGSGRGLRSLAYVTVGTGVGVACVERGRFVGGGGHPELGHIFLPRAPEDEFPGVCPYHGSCWEGLASGPAVERRTGRRGEELAEDDPVWPVVAHYVAHGLLAVTYACAPERIVLGGGVGSRPIVFRLVRAQFSALLAGYTSFDAPLHAETYIVPPALGDQSGVLGALALAREEFSA
ncbi:MAG: Fructokinase [Brockia lithotrophica]|uniref:fructokinase n=1 Tax=Brockia lithotrophica TaxID=933949 RepID=A0A2T5GAV0_9BACL|nr:ROK family protein [Brockia lithotrophica]PTQ53307.1 MAG: Fructokinase [Brockia lithotrophica]